MQAFKGSVKSIQVAIRSERVPSYTNDILEKRGMSPIKYPHFDLPIFKGDHLLEAFENTIKEKGLAIDGNQKCLTALESLSKRIKVQEFLNSEEHVIT